LRSRSRISASLSFRLRPRRAPPRAAEAGADDDDAGASLV
jgi:hypothetical protein